MLLFSNKIVRLQKVRTSFFKQRHGNNAIITSFLNFSTDDSNSNNSDKGKANTKTASSANNNTPKWTTTEEIKKAANTLA